MKISDALRRIDLGCDFTIGGIKAAIERERENLLFGAMDRNQYCAEVFAFHDPSNLPIGHLLDHRVKMPPADVERLLAADEYEIADLLTSMLHWSHHSEAAPLVAEALGLDPKHDGSIFAEIRETHRAFFKRAIGGDLQDAVNVFRSDRRGLEFERAKQMIARMLLYYGALQLQLIAGRSRAIADLRIGMQGDGGVFNMNALMSDLMAAMVSIIKAAEGVQRETPLRGRRPELIKLLEDKANEVLARCSDRDRDDLLAELRRSMQELSKIADDGTTILDAVPAAAPGNQVHVDTVIEEIRIGEQIALAGLRLAALAPAANKFAARSLAGTALSFERWIKLPMPARRNVDVANLIFVHRAIGAGDVAAGVPFLGGRESSLKNQSETFQSRGCVPGENLIKEVKTKMPRMLLSRAPVGTGDLIDAQRWDVLPDYYLHFIATPPTKTASGAGRKMGYVKKEGRPPNLRKMPRRAPRP